MKQNLRNNPYLITIYALYRGDKFIDVGTVKEIAKRYGLSEQTIRHYYSKAHKRRMEEKGFKYENTLMLYKIGVEPRWLNCLLTR